MNQEVLRQRAVKLIVAAICSRDPTHCLEEKPRGTLRFVTEVDEAARIVAAQLPFLMLWATVSILQCRLRLCLRKLSLDLADPWLSNMSGSWLSCRCTVRPERSVQSYS